MAAFIASFDYSRAIFAAISPLEIAAASVMDGSGFLWDIWCTVSFHFITFSSVLTFLVIDDNLITVVNSIKSKTRIGNFCV